MPGIAQQPTQTIDPSAITAIGQDKSTVKPIEDLMAAFRSGFITVDDLTRRAQNKPVEESQRQTTLQANDLQRKQIAAENELLPGRVDAARQQQSLESVTAPARAAVVTKQARDAQLLAESPDLYHAQKAKEATEQIYAERMGRLPETLTIKNPEKAIDFSEWQQLNAEPIAQRRQQLAAQYPAYPNDVSGDNPEYLKADSALNKQLGVEYQQYLKDSKEVKVPRGSPEYDQQLRKEANDLLRKEAVSGVNFKAYAAGQEAKAKAEAEAPSKSQASAQSNRKDYSALDEIQALRKVDAAYRKVKTAVTSESSPFQDMSAIFGFMKVLDPGSTVREGEYATAENARAVPETIKNFYNKVVNGTKLTPEQRTQLLTATEGNLKGQVQNALPRIKQYSGIENQLGLAPGEIVPLEDRNLITQYSNPTTPAPGTAQPYTLKDGTKVPVGGTVNNGGRLFKWDGARMVEVTAPPAE